MIESALFELALERCAVGLGGATPEIFHVIGRHVPMLAHRPDDSFAASRPRRTVRAKSRAMRQFLSLRLRRRASAENTLDRRSGGPAWDGKEPWFPCRIANRWPASLSWDSGSSAREPEPRYR